MFHAWILTFTIIGIIILGYIANLKTFIIATNGQLSWTTMKMTLILKIPGILERDISKVTTEALLKNNAITGYYGRLRLLTRGQLTEPLLNSLFTKTPTISETMKVIH